MSDQHTPEPWHWDSDPIKGDPLDRVRFRVTAVGRTITQMYYSSGDPVAEADARRIVACVNSCADMSTEYLEQCGKVRRNEAGESIVELIQQRDELLAALAQCASALEYESGKDHIEILANARAALAKVKS